MDLHDQNELYTWKLIAEHLGVSVRTAKYYEEKHGMPVHRLPGPKSRVWAYARELDHWKRQSAASSLASQEPPPGSESPPVVLAIIPPKASSNSLGLRAVAICILLLSTVIGAAVYEYGGADRVLADHRIQGNELVGIDGKGRSLWSHKFEVQVAGYQSLRDKHRRSWLGRFYPAQQPNLLFTDTSVQSDRDSGNQLLCLRQDGTTAWTFRPGYPVQDRSGDKMLPPYSLNNLQVVSGLNGREPRIVVSSHHYLSQPDQVAVLDPEGRVLGEYWHPGHLLHLTQATLRSRDHPSVLLGGVNNGYHQATLVSLNPWQVSGVSTPKNLPDWRFELIGMRAAQEEGVILFPRSCISRGQPYTRVMEVRVTPDRIVATVTEGPHEERDPRIVYELDYGLQVVNVVPTDSAREKHRQLEASGELDHPYSLAEFAALKTRVTYLRPN